MGVQSAGGQLSPLLGGIEHPPAGGDEPETRDDEYHAQEVERPEMRVGLPAEEHLQ